MCLYNNLNENLLLKNITSKIKEKVVSTAKSLFYYTAWIIKKVAEH